YAEDDPKTARALLIMHDMGDEVRFGNDKIEVSKSMAEDMVRTLAGVHSVRIEQQQFRAWGLKNYSTFWRGLVGFFPDMPDCCDKAFERSMDAHIVPNALKKWRGGLWKSIMSASDRHLALPETLIHNDVHFKNWYIVKSTGR